MTARALWKATLIVGDEQVGVKLYSAAVDKRVHFRLLHRTDRAPVEQRMVHPVTGRTVEADDTRRGIEVEHGRFVEVEQEDLDALEPRASRDLRVLRFVPAGVLDTGWYRRPYYLGPDGDPTRLALLVKAVQQSGREGIAHWTMRGRSQVGALRVHAGALMLVSLRSLGEVVAAGSLDAPTGADLDKRELALARQLVDALSDSFRHADYADEYRERVLDLVRAKERGKTIRLERFEPRPDSGESLLASLEASLKRAG